MMWAFIPTFAQFNWVFHVFSNCSKQKTNLQYTTLTCFISGEMDIRIANKYRLGRKIGGGSFGDLYLGAFAAWMIVVMILNWVDSFSAINIHTGEEVAIKLEQAKTKHPQLHIECKFYKVMQGGGENWMLKEFLAMSDYGSAELEGSSKKDGQIIEQLGNSIPLAGGFCCLAGPWTGLPKTAPGTPWKPQIEALKSRNWFEVATDRKSSDVSFSFPFCLQLPMPWSEMPNARTRDFLLKPFFVRFRQKPGHRPLVVK